jgi:hypothetical protein
MDSRPTPARLRSAARASALALAIALLLVGCGSLGGLPGRVQEPQLVTTRDIERYPESSPVRTVLSWWRALQFNSPELAVTYYAPEAGVTKKRIEQELFLGPNILNLKWAISAKAVERKGRKATVLALLTKILRHPNGRTDKVRAPLAFTLVQHGGKWRLAENRYLDGILHNVKGYIEASKQRQKRLEGR